MKSASVLLPLSLLPFLACGGNGNVLGTPPPPSGSDLYASGYETINGVSVAKVWKNGAIFQTLGNGAAPSVANGLALAGTDLLAAGSQGPSATKAATFWRNGTAQPALTDGTTAAEAAAVAVNGSDVYLAGYLTAP